MVTTDLSMFHLENLTEMIDMLIALRDGKPLPKDFAKHNVQVALNTESGVLFLTNSEGHVCVLEQDNSTFYSIYISPNSGIEGRFEALLVAYPSLSEDDKEWLEMIADAIERSDEIPYLSIDKFGNTVYVYQKPL